MRQEIFNSLRLLLIGTLLGGGVVSGEAVQPCDLVYRFPTKNHALLDDRGEDFYMYCDRNF